MNGWSEAAGRTGPGGQRVLLVVGPSCAGKSTFGEHAAAARGAFFVEASAVLRQALGGARTPPGDRGGVAALASLGYGAVAERAIELVRTRSEPLVVISGFRTIEELDRLVEHAPHSEVVHVHAPVRVRYERCRLRSRLDAADRLETFRSVDADVECSLQTVARQVARFRIVNGGSMEDFRLAIEAVLDGGDRAPGLTLSRVGPRGRPLYATLRELLRPARRPHLSAAEATILRRYPRLATVRLVAGQWHAETSTTASAYVRCVERLFPGVETSAGEAPAMSSSSSA